MPDETQTPEMVQISKEQWDNVQKQLAMLTQVADKGRIANYESQQGIAKKPFTVQLSEYQGGIIVGWRVIKDQPVFHPTTGKQVGEEQQIEVLVDKQGTVEKVLLNSYPAFTEARYAKRIVCNVVAKKEDTNGNWTYDVQLPDGRVLPLDVRFVN